MTANNTAEEHHPIINYWVSASMGQPRYTPTTLAVIEQVVGYKGWVERGFTGSYDWAETKLSSDQVSYNIVGLTRFDKKKPYTDQIALIKRRMADTENLGKGKGFDRNRGRAQVRLAADMTGTGAPLYSLMQANDLEPLAVILTMGDAVMRDEAGIGHKVPRRDMVNLVALLMEQDRLTLSSELVEGPKLYQEMLNFRHDVTLAGGKNESPVAWRDGETGDLLLSVATGLWAADQGLDNGFYQYLPGDPVYDALVNFTGK